jgi:hypothetical protein
MPVSVKDSLCIDNGQVYIKTSDVLYDSHVKYKTTTKNLREIRRYPRTTVPNRNIIHNLANKARIANKYEIKISMQSINKRKLR